MSESSTLVRHGYHTGEEDAFEHFYPVEARSLWRLLVVRGVGPDGAYGIAATLKIPEGMVRHRAAVLFDGCARQSMPPDPEQVRVLQAAIRALFADAPEPDRVHLGTAFAFSCARARRADSAAPGVEMALDVARSR